MTKILILMLVCLSTSSIAGVLPSKPHIYVEGKGEIEVTPDLLRVTVVLEATDHDVVKAREIVEERTLTLIEASRALDIADTAISTTALRIGPSQQYINGELVVRGTEVGRNVDITLTELIKYPELMTALVDANISALISAELDVSDSEVLLDQAMLVAVEDARGKAERLASLQGKKLGKVHSISEFDLRREDKYLLSTTRHVRGSSSGSTTNYFSAPSKAKQSTYFEPGVITAAVRIYVVYYLE